MYRSAQGTGARALLLFLLFALLLAWSGRATAASPPNAARTSSLSSGPGHVWVVALGDSYTAGNGAGNYYGTISCHRSYDDYAWRYVTALRNTMSADIWVAACSGAVTSDIYDQISSVGLSFGLEDEIKTQAKVVLLTIGGNDFNFAGLAGWCLVGADPLLECPNILNTALDGFDNIANNRVYNDLATIHVRMPNAQIVLI